MLPLGCEAAPNLLPHTTGTSRYPVLRLLRSRAGASSLATGNSLQRMTKPVRQPVTRQ
ncbi:hypothetical protein EMIT0194MI4_40222 [Pseudomonas sp. IT-194MI4]